jgi:hypothetical protein
MKILIIFLFVFVTATSTAQNSLSNTKWKGTMLIPDAVNVHFSFKKDTLYLTNDTGEEVETLLYSVQNDSLNISKISGSSPCPEQAQGLYHIEWLDNKKKIQLHAIRDECEGRMGVFTLYPIVKM